MGSTPAAGVSRVDASLGMAAFSSEIAMPAARLPRRAVPCVTASRVKDLEAGWKGGFHPISHCQSSARVGGETSRLAPSAGGFRRRVVACTLPGGVKGAAVARSDVAQMGRAIATHVVQGLGRSVPSEVLQSTNELGEEWCVTTASNLGISTKGERIDGCIEQQQRRSVLGHLRSDPRSPRGRHPLSFREGASPKHSWPEGQHQSQFKQQELQNWWRRQQQQSKLQRQHAEGGKFRKRHLSSPKKLHSQRGSMGTPLRASGQPQVFHIVEEGETLWSIARMYSVRVKDLMLLNDVDVTHLVSLHTVLLIPPASSSKSRSGTPFSAVSAPSSPVAATTNGASSFRGSSWSPRHSPFSNQVNAGDRRWEGSEGSRPRHSADAEREDGGKTEGLGKQLGQMALQLGAKSREALASVSAAPARAWSAAAKPLLSTSKVLAFLLAVTALGLAVFKALRGIVYSGSTGAKWILSAAGSFSASKGLLSKTRWVSESSLISGGGAGSKGGAVSARHRRLAARAAMQMRAPREGEGEGEVLTSPLTGRRLLRDESGPLHGDGGTLSMEGKDGSLSEKPIVDQRWQESLLRSEGSLGAQGRQAGDSPIPIGTKRGSGHGSSLKETECWEEDLALTREEMIAGYPKDIQCSYEAFLRDSGAQSAGRFRGGMPPKFRSGTSSERGAS